MLKNQIKLMSMVAIAAVLAVSSCAEKPEMSDQKANKAENYKATDYLAKTLPEIAQDLQQGTITSQSLVKAYLQRIQAVDKNGPTLQSIISLNPTALQEAVVLDIMREAGDIKGPLHGIPVLLKDNIETTDTMPTTAGALALQDNVTGRDSPLVAGLRAQGAIILGKTNLSQWANFRSEDSMSGWSALGGQVRNPHMLDHNPCGSSSGSGAAAAASLAAGTVGTETNGSIICPSTVNGVVGFKPTVGLVPQDLIIPISATQDTAGPITKSVMGAAMMMDAMATGATAANDINFTAGLTKDSLKGVRIGVLNFARASYGPIDDLFNQALKDLEAAGAILVPIDRRPKSPSGTGKMAYDLLKYEFKDGLNKYLASTDPKQVKIRSLADLIAFNEAHKDIELALFDQSILVASEALGSLEDDDYKKALKTVPKAMQDNIDGLLKGHNVAVLVSPSGVLAPRVDAVNGDVWPGGWPGYGSAAARAGYPHATVPMGGVKALPVGLSFIGTAMNDAAILSYAYAYEQQSKRRLSPNYYKNVEDIAEVAKAMRPYKGQ